MLGVALIASMCGPENVSPRATPASASAPATPRGSATPAAFASFPVPTAGARVGEMAASADGGVWFLEPEVGRIGRVDAGGRIRDYPIGSAGNWLSDLAVSGDGSVWWTEAGANQVGRMTPSGETRIFRVGGGPGGLAPASDGGMWVTEFAGNRLARITAAGSVSEFEPLPPLVGPGGGPADVVTGPDAAAWFTEDSRSMLGRLDADGRLTEYSTRNLGGKRLLFGPDGNLWFTGTYCCLARMSASGDWLGPLDVPPPGALAQLASGPDRSVWAVLTASGQNGPPGAGSTSLVKITSDGRPTLVATPAGAAITSVAATANVVWFAEPSGGGRIWRYLPTT